MENATEENKIPEGFAQLQSGILLKENSPALAALIKEFLAKKMHAAAARKTRRQSSRLFVVKGFSPEC